MTVLEWLAARRPVLVSPRGGAAEIVDELEGVIPVQPDAGEIVRAIEELSAPDRWHDLLPRVRRPKPASRTGSRRTNASITRPSAAHDRPHCHLLPGLDDGPQS